MMTQQYGRNETYYSRSFVAPSSLPPSPTLDRTPKPSDAPNAPDNSSQSFLAPGVCVYVWGSASLLWGCVGWFGDMLCFSVCAL